LYWWGKEAKGCEGHWRHCILDGFRPQVKECRDVTELTEGIIILSAVTHCYLFTSLTEKGDLLAGITVFT